MKSLNIDNALIENYLGLIKNLSPRLKLDLIERLTKSINMDSGKREKLFKKSFGAWKSKKPANDIILEIKESRGFYRNIEPFE